jgi:hypothetical protein
MLHSLKYLCWENRPILNLIDTHDWRPLKYTQIYAMSRLLIITLSIILSMLSDKSNNASFEFPESLTQELGPGRVEPPEDIGKGGDLWHGCAGADEDLARA